MIGLIYFQIQVKYGYGCLLIGITGKYSFQIHILYCSIICSLLHLLQKCRQGCWKPEKVGLMGESM